MIRFDSITEEASFTGPGGETIAQTIEHRTDPLTGAVCSLNGVLGEKAKAFLGTADVEALRTLQEQSKATCPFCVADERGTRFPADFIPDGFLRAGDSLAVPNLFAKAGLDAVVIVNLRRHELFPAGLAARDLGNSVQLGVDLLRRARERLGLAHHVMGMNFLHPAGSSVPHPHFQVHARGVPFSGVFRLLDLSRAWREAEGRSYWEELVAAERAGGSRYLGSTGRVEWLVPFAPAHQKEAWGILPGIGSLREAHGGPADDFGAGLGRLASFYEKDGHHAFNAVFYSAPAEGAGDRFSLHVRLCARPAFRPLYCNYDTWFTPKFVGDEVHTSPPEEYGARMREFFG